jgi:8-oxo-dGTP diphosphatase
MTQEVHFVGKVAQKVIIRRDTKVLIVRDVGDADTWELPGGRLHVHEDPKMGLAREVREELGIEIIAGNIVYLEQFIQLRSGELHLALVYEATTTDANGVLVLQPDEIAQFAWVDKDTWQKYRYFAEYERALAHYFSRI